MWVEIILRLAFLLALLIIADIWSIRGLRRTLIRRGRKRTWPKVLVLGSSLLFLGFTLYTFTRQGMPGLDPDRLRSYYSLATAFLFIYGPKLVLALPVLTEDIIFLIIHGTGRLFSRRTRFSPPLFRNSRRFPLLAWPALIASMLIFIFLAEGFLFRRHMYIIRNVPVVSSSVPEGFNGFRIAQFSDAHLGSFHNASHVRKGLGLISSSRPDIILFTGDLVNSSFREAIPYAGMLRQLSAPYGKYAILGNHDMDDFMKWTEEKGNETDSLVSFWEDAGFTVLRNSNVLLTENGDSMILAGVDNWGLPPFRQEGDLRKALKGSGSLPVILMSHDPSHWDAEVLDFPGVFLTCSGHTHAMQFAIDIPGLIHWSPSEWKYPHWAGLYEKDGRYLHVNPGFGYIGFLLRSGTRPEITMIELRSSN